MGITDIVPHDAVAWWTAFGAVAQALGAAATFAAVAISLWVVLSERAMRARVTAGIRIIFAGDGTPGLYLIGIEVLNTGLRAFEISTVGWRTGWMRRGPKATQYRFAIQNTSVMYQATPGPHILEPGRTKGFYTTVEDMKGEAGKKSREELFVRPVPLLGFAPIYATVNIVGRKPVYAKVSRDLAEFLRTGEHAATTHEEAIKDG